MTQDMTRSILAIAIVVGFFALMFVVLFGFVAVTDPTIAKLVGLLFGYVTGLIQPIILLYFGTLPTTPTPPPET